HRHVMILEPQRRGTEPGKLLQAWLPLGHALVAGFLDKLAPLLVRRLRLGHPKAIDLDLAQGYRVREFLAAAPEPASGNRAHVGGQRLSRRRAAIDLRRLPLLGIILRRRWASEPVANAGGCHLPVALGNQPARIAQITHDRQSAYDAGPKVPAAAW